MKLGDPIDARVPWLRKVHDLDDARSKKTAGVRCDALRSAGERLGDSLREGPKVISVRTLPLTTVPYPTTFAFNRAVPLPWPFIVMTHRTLLVQVLAEGTIRNILFNPTDYEASAQTPFFKELADKVGERVGDLLRTKWDHVDVQLETLGISAEDIDVVAFDHFHTQDLRPILGSNVPRPDGSRYRARFPNAVLLAPRPEWEDWDHLHPMQKAWFIADGHRGVPEAKVVLTDNDVALGQGCLLLRTPGHTSGNQTIFVHGERGVFGCSENGTSADCWAPYESRIPGLRDFVRRYGVEVVLNSNTPELGAEQYNSMILERSVVDRVAEAPAFVQMFPSSEVTPSFLAPGIKPTMIFEERDSGVVVPRRERTKTSAAYAPA